MKTILTICILLLTAGFLTAQNSMAAQLNIHLNGLEGAQVGQEIELVIEVTPKAGWHVYSALPIDDMAYRPAEIGWDVASRGFEVVGAMAESGKRIDKMDEMMGGMTRYYEGPVSFVHKLKITESEVKVVGYFDYMACNELQCIPFSADFALDANIQDSK